MTEWFLIILTAWPPHLPETTVEVNAGSQSACVRAMQSAALELAKVEDEDFTYTIRCESRKRTEKESS